MLSREKLLEVLDADLTVCRGAAGQLIPSDAQGKQRNILEFNTLLQHQQWADRAFDNQDELERIVSSLENNGFLHGYQRWRERSQIS
jgi:hypothetical protein